MNRFYTTLIYQGRLTLIDQEAKHCSKVLRKVIGDKITVINGAGSTYECIIREITKKEVICEITESKSEANNPMDLHIGVGLIKSSARIEWMIEKLTEIGIAAFTPIICKRSERPSINIDRIKKIVISATKQSLQTWVPVVKDPITFEQFILTQDGGYIASYDVNAVDFSSASAPKNSLILIGPEGDFTDKELELALSKGFQRVNLGQHRLRTETAALVAATIFNMQLKI